MKAARRTLPPTPFVLPPKLRAPLLFSAFSLLLWVPGFLGGKALFYDTLWRLFQPYADFAGAAFRAGRLPFWNPHIYAGVPFLANMQSALFYPATWLYAVMPFPRALVLSAALHGALGAFFMGLSARRIGLSEEGSVLAGLAFGFNGFCVMHYAYPSQFTAYAWTPVILYFVLEALRKGTAAPLVLAACAAAAQVFAGHPQFVIYTWAALSVVVLSRADRRRGSAVLAAAGLGALLLSAVQTGPAWALIRLSPRWAGLGEGWSGGYSLSPRESLLMWLLPAWNRFFSPASGDSHIVGFYFGLPLLALAIGGMVRRGGTSRAPFAALVVLGTLLSWGIHLPGFRLLSRLPVLGALRFPAQAAALVCFALPFLAGRGLELVPARGRRAVLLLCAADLWFFSRGAVKTIDASFYAPPSAEAGIAGLLRRRDGLSRLLMAPRTRLEKGRAGKTELEAWESFRDSLYPNAAMSRGLYDAEGYEELRFGDYDRVLEEMEKRPRSAWLNLFNVRYVLSKDEIPGRPFAYLGEAGLRVYENPGRLDRAYFRPMARAYPLDFMFSLVSNNPGMDFSKCVLLTTDVPSPGAGSAASAGTVRVAEYGADRVVLESAADGPGWVVLADAWDAGWRAAVDGAPAPVLRANFFQRAVAVDGGAHRIVFEYVPPGFAGAAATSAAALLAAALFCLRRRPLFPPAGI